MSLIIKPSARVFVYREAIDMRAGFGRLQALVAEQMKGNLFEGNLFVFLGKNPRRVKMLLFDGTGLVLITKLPVSGLTLEEVEKILAQPNTEDLFGIRDRAMIEVLYSTGIRREELCNVQIYDVDATKGTLVVRQGKGKQDRVVPIGARALEWVDKYITEVRPAVVADPDHGYLFVAPRGGKLRVRVLGETVHGYIKKAGIKKKGSCHLFRHAMATHMLENGAEIRALQQMLGHKQIVSTQRYTNVTIMKLKEIHAATHPADNSKKDEVNGESQENPAVKKLRAIPGGRI